MTSKEFVKKHIPLARAERHVEGRIIGMKKPYWLIRNGKNYLYVATGKTESKAWVNAKKIVEESIRKNYKIE